jgi:hypothetical protein
MHSIVILEVPYENNFRWTVFNYLIVQLYVLIHNQTTCPKKARVLYVSLIKTVHSYMYS